MGKLALHWQIIIGMVLGGIFGYIMTQVGGAQFTADWVKPIGKIFINLLKLIAIPLIIASLIKGISDLKDISKFKTIGLRTILLYIMSTVIAITIGLIVVNTIRPGSSISPELMAEISGTYEEKANAKISSAGAAADRGPLQFLVDMVPDNFFKAASNNGSMLQIIFFVIFFGISLLLIKPEESKPVKAFFDGLNEVVLKMVDLIMLIAPIAVFALIASLITEISNPEIFIALAKYAMTVVLGLAIMIVFYLILINTKIGYSPGFFLKNFSPAQLLAFSTSSSAATLPVTMERVEEHLGVDQEVSSFVLPVGATVNMDGTSLYQAVAAVFICQVTGFELGLGDQLTIILTATLASIGSAAVPGAGMIMLVIVLEALGLPTESLAIGIALIFAVDRPLDMCRTVINVTGDATVSMLVAKSIDKINIPEPKNWDDNYGK
ncbi:MAG: dicarboxylate/amino acid:cation symporter [Saprospiraceae bacterium]|nr:dicarboxylate/amino acid:cation symporter [Saprospiraceae bacterium]